MTEVSDWMDNSMSRALFTLTCGEVLGEGIHRVVHRCKFDPSLVLKFEYTTNVFANTAEWLLWKETEYQPHLRRWLAPCVAISNSGDVLLQKYVEPIDKKRLPKRVPKFMADLKISNWGLYEGRPVACDYANNVALADGLTKRMRKADWTLE